MSHAKLLEATKLFSRTPPLRGAWPRPIELDATSGGAAFGYFDQAFPGILSDNIDAGLSTYLCIGDVDNLKELIYRGDNINFIAGHVIANRLIMKVGYICREYLGRAAIHSGCVASFGGDEIILAMSGLQSDLTSWLEEMQESVRLATTRTISFSCVEIKPVDRSPIESARSLYCRALYTVDKCLLNEKLERKKHPEIGTPFIVISALESINE